MTCKSQYAGVTFEANSFLVCFRLRNSRLREWEKARTRTLNGRELGRGRAPFLFSHHRSLFPGSRSDFRWPFTKVSLLPSDSLEQANSLFTVLISHYRVPKTLTFIIRFKCATFVVKMSFICMRMKNHFHIKG